MIETQESSSGFDIGIDPSVPGPARRIGDDGPSRSLPRWVLVLVALLIGWLLGSLLGGRTNDQSTLATPGPVVEESAELATERAGVAATTSIPLTGSTLIIAQLSGSDRLPSAITSIDSQQATVARVGERIAGPTQAVGQVGRRVQVVGDDVLFIAGRQAMVVQAGSSEPPLAITEAATLLAGSSAGTAWAVSADTLLVQLLDVQARQVVATYDLSGVGTPVASHSGGLVVLPVVERFGPFALWSPARGLERLWGIDEQTVLIGASGSTIAVQTAQGLASYNTVTGALTQTRRQLAEHQVASAVLSPTGAFLAVVQGPASGSGVQIGVIDLATGDVIDGFNTGAPWLLTWAARDALLYLSHTDETTVQRRDTTLGFDTALADLATSATWFVLAG